MSLALCAVTAATLLTVGAPALAAGGLKLDVGRGFESSPTESLFSDDIVLSSTDRVSRQVRLRNDAGQQGSLTLRVIDLFDDEAADCRRSAPDVGRCGVRLSGVLVLDVWSTQARVWSGTLTAAAAGVPLGALPPDAVSDLRLDLRLEDAGDPYTGASSRFDVQIGRAHV